MVDGVNPLRLGTTLATRPFASAPPTVPNQAGTRHADVELRRALWRGVSD